VWEERERMWGRDAAEKADGADDEDAFMIDHWLITGYDPIAEI